MDRPDGKEGLEENHLTMLELPRCRPRAQTPHTLRPGRINVIIMIIVVGVFFSSESMTVNARVFWPAAPLTASLVQGALKRIAIPISYVSTVQTNDDPLLQWSTYDEIDHESTHINPGTVLSSSYIFRKALIRKHYLSRVIRSFLTKNPSSVLSNATPRTYEIEISFADELEEMWTDELWELGNELSSGNKLWWILKPSAFFTQIGIFSFLMGLCF